MDRDKMEKEMKIVMAVKEVAIQITDRVHLHVEEADVVSFSTRT